MILCFSELTAFRLRSYLFFLSTATISTTMSTRARFMRFPTAFRETPCLTAEQRARQQPGTGASRSCPANLSYNIDASGEKLICIHFCPNVPLSDKIRCFHTENRKYFDRKFAEILDVWQKKPLAGRHECMSLFYRLIYMIEREYLSEKPESPTARIVAAAEYINEHLTEDINVSALADSAAMSETYFRRLFAEKFGLSPIKYICKMRADYAKELLGTGYYSVSEVAARCGFNDVNYFSLFMKKQTGSPPSKLF